ncbi:MAG: undecaprenyl-diphosphate phosphatase [Candidatus Marinimicrobia bacterium]|nr:undecaprenyl-diphosphate phosphatase [Candidatus Neomarinimicrobiota bacterium]
MNFIESLLLGMIQGLTEFLPVSSSGHLVIFQKLLGIASDNLAFEIIVHLGTLMSVFVVFYNDLLNLIKSLCIGIRNPKSAYIQDEYFKLAIQIMVGTIPAVFAGLLFKDFFERIFHNSSLVGITLIITGAILLSTKFLNKIDKKLSLINSLLIGTGQALAIFPGISRSGTTISTALFCGISKREAARFSFLLSIPAILGAAVLEIKDLIISGISGQQILSLATGFLSSFLVGYLAIRFLLNIINKGKFFWFAPYCFLAGLFVLILL